MDPSFELFAVEVLITPSLLYYTYATYNITCFNCEDSEWLFLQNWVYRMKVLRGELFVENSKYLRMTFELGFYVDSELFSFINLRTFIMISSNTYKILLIQYFLYKVWVYRMKARTRNYTRAQKIVDISVWLLDLVLKFTIIYFYHVWDIPWSHPLLINTFNSILFLSSFN